MQDSPIAKLFPPMKLMIRKGRCKPPLPGNLHRVAMRAAEKRHKRLLRQKLGLTWVSIDEAQSFREEVAKGAQEAMQTIVDVARGLQATLVPGLGKAALQTALLPVRIPKTTMFNLAARSGSQRASRAGRPHPPRRLAIRQIKKGPRTRTQKRSSWKQQRRARVGKWKNLR